MQGWWNMDIRWHHYKHFQMPKLTLPCWKACRDDRIGHLVHPIRSPDAKIMQITSFGHVLCRGCRPAGPAPLPNTTSLATGPLGTHQWSLNTWEASQKWNYDRKASYVPPMGFQSDQTKYQDPNQLEQEHTTARGHVGAKQGREEPIPGRLA